jgi:hypothetical protein
MIFYQCIRLDHATLNHQGEYELGGRDASTSTRAARDGAGRRAWHPSTTGEHDEPGLSALEPNSKGFAADNKDRVRQKDAPAF